MATVEPAPGSTGPRYAPDDPTLPKPWKGLIDGSTGILYYWNPETNITQYERPASLPPPLPLGPPPAVPTPKLAPIPMPRTLQPNGMPPHQGQQLAQTNQQQGQVMTQSTQQQVQPTQHQGIQIAYAAQQQLGTQAAQAGQQQDIQMGQAMQQHGHLAQQLSQQMLQQPAQPTLHHPGQQMPQHMGQQVQLQQGRQTPQRQAEQMPRPQGQQYLHNQWQQMPYQQTPYPQGQQMSSQQAQHIAHQQGQQFPHHQGVKMSFPQEENDVQPGKQTRFSPQQIPHMGASSHQNLSTTTNSIQIPHAGGHLVHHQQFGGPSVNMQQHAASLVQLQQSGTDSLHRQQTGGPGPTLRNQMGSARMHNQQPVVPSTGLKMGYEEDPHGRVGNEFYTHHSSEGPAMGPEQPKLAAIPITRNQQEMRISGIPPQNVTPGHAGLNVGAVPNMFNHVVGGPAFSNNATMRPPPRMFGSSDVTNLTPVEIYRQQHEVSATGDNVPAPYMTFEATGFPPEILREIHSAGFSSPTPIQAQTWPIALQGKDIVAIAKTGSGKTLGYLIPIFIHLRRCHNNSQNGPTVLVLAPTRELATQIQDEANKFGRSSRVSCTCLYGGAPKGPQLKELDRGADIVVATPGRLNDILEMKKIDFQQVSLLVLDEADRMLDMGFEPQIRKIVNEIPPRRQTLMYTATWPKEVRKIANDLLVNPVQVNIGSVDELAANKAITQHVEVVPQMEKQRRLEQILRSQERGSKVIVFCSTKRLCDQLARTIGRNFGAAAIHGDKSQGERDWVLNQFRSGKSPILVATDVAARGLDIKDIRVVINYDFPTGIEDYVHRIGRTGRAGATGMAYTFFSDQDWKYAADLIKVLEGANQRVPQEVREMAVRGGPSFGKGRGGINRWDSGGGRWDSGGRGGMRDGGFGGRGGRNDFFPGRGNRGRGFGGTGGGPVGWGRHDRGTPNRYNSMDGRGRYNNRRSIPDRSRGRSYSRSYSPSPERVRTWDYKRSRSPSSRSRSRSRSRGRSRSWSRSHSRSRSCSYSRSRSRSYDRHERLKGQNLKKQEDATTGAEYDVPPESRMSPISPGTKGGNELANQQPVVENTEPGCWASGDKPIHEPVAEL